MSAVAPAWDLNFEGGSPAKGPFAFGMAEMEGFGLWVERLRPDGYGERFVWIVDQERENGELRTLYCGISNCYVSAMKEAAKAAQAAAEGRRALQGL